MNGPKSTQAELESVSPSTQVVGSGPTASVTRPRAERADKARNRARILAAASEAFAATGVETQMDDIAARAGLGVGTLYRHFPTKEALLVALVERKFELILDVTQRGTERQGVEPFTAFADVMRAGAEVAAADAGAQDALMRAGDFVWEAVEPTLVRLRAATQILIDRAQSAGAMRGDVSAEDIPMIMCGVSATMSVNEWDWRRYLELVLDGLRAEAQIPPG